MGVPKFYRWISERYPKINQVVSDNVLLPEFDHLYLDMNGIVHGCTHPADQDLSNGLSERDMMLGIMHYLDRIITIVKPKVSIYMAIDGVAPRAKLNQQRSRRFRSAMELVEATKNIPKDQQGDRSVAVFDSNCITPGTDFLAKVSAYIQYFIRKKIKEDPDWRNLQVIFSGHDIPGEGEHKIMQHIREMRAQPNYQPNTRHCIYGQDADLIMLGLVTHEPHFTILREVVNFNFFNNKNTLKAVKKFTKESDFQLLHLSILREYLQMEFESQPPEYDLERIIDDFVFMTFLVGNDFLPHMPTLDIGDGAFDLLFKIYKEQRRIWGRGNYLTELGEISDPRRLETYLSEIGKEESDILEKREKDDEVYQEKRRKWDKRDGKLEGPSKAELLDEEDTKQSDYMTMIRDLLTKNNKDKFVDGWKPVTEAGQKDFKGRYYFEKMGLTPVDKEKHWALRRSYMEGLRWCLAYYYKGCISWGWFYPYHYGPMLSDLLSIPKMFDEMAFDLGMPLTPFQQLMGCLPPGSVTLVPKLYQWLMISPESTIIQFYPQSFEVDMNGKKNPWEGVNLLPFIDIQLLKDTIAKYCPDSNLSADERKRNTIGTVFCYRYDTSCTDVVESPGKGIGLGDIVTSNSSVKLIEADISLSKLVFEPKLINGTQSPYPGFPSLNVLPIASFELVSIGVNCFGSASKYPTMMLTLHPIPELPAIEHLAENVVDKSLFVNWPMMHESKVIAISDDSKEIRRYNGKIVVKEHSKVLADQWLVDTDNMSRSYFAGNGVPGTGGIQIGGIKIRLKVLPLQGMKTSFATGSTKKVFGKEEADVPLQLALWQAPAPDPRFIERGPVTLKDRFPAGSNVLLTKGKYRGCMGAVIGVINEKTVGVKVFTIPPEIPFGLAIARSVQESYISSMDAARILKINPGVLGKVMGKLQFFQGKYDLGLNLKTNDGMCVIGYTRKKIEEKKNSNNTNGKTCAWEAGDSVLVVGSRMTGIDSDEEDERIQWEYTPKAIRLVETYKSKFPQLFASLKKKPNEKRYDANEVFGAGGEAWLPVVRDWLDKHESAKIPRSPITTKAMSVEAVAAVQKAADVRSVVRKKKGYPQESLLKIPGSALYREGSIGATDVLLAGDLNDNISPELGDRVVNLCADGVPFGARGIVIGIHEAYSTGSVEVVMDEEFIGGTSLQGQCSNFRGKLCLWSHLLKIAPDNSQELVDTIVSKGTRDTAVKETLDGMLADAEKNIPVEIKTSWDSRFDASIQSINQPTSRPQSAMTTLKTPPRSSSRANSSGRHRQGGYKEARGPDEKGIGFKELRRSGRNGFKRWKLLIRSKTDSIATETSLEQTALDLKKILGVSTTPASNLSAVRNPQPSTTQNNQTQLKPTLPVDQKIDKKLASLNVSTASADLKAMLGLQSVISSPEAPMAPATAADKLMQLMVNKQFQGVGPTVLPPPLGFSFAYVDEGKEQSSPPNLPSTMIPPNYPHFPTQASGYGSPPTIHSLAHPSQPHSIGATLAQFGPLSTVQSTSTNDDFPPLSGDSPYVASIEHSNKAPHESTVLLPSVVAGKARR